MRCGGGKRFPTRWTLFLRQGTPPSWFRGKGNAGLNKGRRREFAGKPKGMNKQTRKTKHIEDGFITAPG